MKGTNKLIIVDLDETLVTCNSLHLFFKCAMSLMLKKGQLWRLAKSLTTLTARRLHLVSHIDMKYRMLSYIKTTDTLKHKFKNKLSKHINPAVLDIINNSHKQGDRILIATAAPDVYMDVVASLPELDDADIISSYYTSSEGNLLAREDIIENRGQVKAHRVNRYLHDHNKELAAVITDHADDMPLINLAQSSGATIYLTGPNPPGLSDAVYI
ncbi:MAG: haloacid dehalogenase-like hydrolase [Muribaculaceae bacterium]|nr:haloacid dehalogenase-like hydrolase [Muribaculaceae bacterium]